MFAERLDYIIKLTNVSTTALAKAANIDASYISKLRNGKRNLPKNNVFITKISTYLAKHIMMNYQVETMCKYLHLTEWPNPVEAAKYIEHWLTDEDATQNDIFTLINAQDAVTAYTKNATDIKKQFYFGNKGKRESALLFLDLVLQSDKPCTLLLFNDEKIDWILEDPTFTKLWVNKFVEALSAGNNIKVIHNLNRNFSEILASFNNWSSMYLTGNVESYYYPYMRDDIMQRTLFVATNTAAITSNSIANKSSGMLSQLLIDKQVIAALTKEFDNYLQLCKVLSINVKYEERQLVIDILKKMTEPAKIIQSMSFQPSLLTMPRAVAASMQKRFPQSCILQTWQKVNPFFEQCLAKSTYRDLIKPLESFDEMPYLLMGSFMDAPGVRYNKEELAQHYHYMEQLSEQSENYQVYYSSTIPIKGTLLSLDESGCILANNGALNFASIFLELELARACIDYLNKIFPSQPPNGEKLFNRY